jgi:hypothetical protein
MMSIIAFEPANAMGSFDELGGNETFPLELSPKVE